MKVAVAPDAIVCGDAGEIEPFAPALGVIVKVRFTNTVAVDPTVVPLGTALYVPELDGMPRDPEGTSRHDGCFIAQDKGLEVKGQHLGIFTGHASTTALWNRMVPSNRGVTVVIESPRCAR